MMPPSTKGALYAVCLCFLVQSVICAKPCGMCSGNFKVPAEYSNVVLDIGANGNEYKCEAYAGAALAYYDSEERCESYFQLIGHTKCGCPRIDNGGARTINDNERCSLCIDGSAPPGKFNKFDLLELGPWEAGGINCLDVSGYVSTFNRSSQLCSKYQSIAVEHCGCPDFSPSNFPSFSPVAMPSHIPSGSPTFLLSNSPSIYSMNPDCNTLDQNHYPSVDSQFLETIKLDYHLKLNHTLGINVQDISLILQKQMSQVVSIEAVPECSSRETKHHHLDHIIFHYVHFHEIEAIASHIGFARGKARVVHSLLPRHARERNLVKNTEAIFNLIKNIVNENAVKIAEGVEGLEAIEFVDFFENLLLEDENPPLSASEASPNTDRNTGVEVGLGIGCTFTLVAAMYAVSKTKRIIIRMRQDPRIEIDSDAIEVVRVPHNDSVHEEVEF